MATRNQEKIIKDLLIHLGENPQREGLKETPKRVLRMYSELVNGYTQNPCSVFKTFDSNGYHDLITIANIDFYSLCEHHLVPFFGKVHIGYIPNGKILGLSKFARLVEVFARRLQTQENLTKQIFDAIMENLHPQACIVRIEAEHMCVSMRGVKKKAFITKTTIKDKAMEKREDLVNQFHKDIQGEQKV